MVTDIGVLFASFSTVVATIFIAELTDKDALLLLALATKIKPWTVFAAGASAFTLTTSIFVTVGYFLVQFFPVFWIKLAGGFVMIVYAVWEFVSKKEKEEKRVLDSTSKRRSRWTVFLSMMSMLAILDIAGDATEVLTIVYVAQIGNALLVFAGCVTALVAASAVETTLGSRLGRLVSSQRIRIFSIVVFLVIGTLIILTTLIPTLLPTFAIMSKM